MSAYSFHPLDSDSGSDNAGVPLFTGNEGDTSSASISADSTSSSSSSSDSDGTTPSVPNAEPTITNVSSSSSSFSTSDALNHSVIIRMEGDIGELETPVVAASVPEMAATREIQRLFLLATAMLLPTPLLAIVEPIRRHIRMRLPGFTLSQMLAVRSAIRVMLYASTAISVLCMIIYGSVMYSLALVGPTTLQLVLWLTGPATHSMLSGALSPFFAIASGCMTWIWYRATHGRYEPFPAHGVLISAGNEDVCPHGLMGCWAITGLLATAACMTLCFALETSVFFYIELNPCGNLWLSDVENRSLRQSDEVHDHPLHNGRTITEEVSPNESIEVDVETLSGQDAPPLIPVVASPLATIAAVVGTTFTATATDIAPAASVFMDIPSTLPSSDNVAAPYATELLTVADELIAVVATPISIAANVIATVLGDASVIADVPSTNSTVHAHSAMAAPTTLVAPDFAALNHMMRNVSVPSATVPDMDHMCLSERTIEVLTEREPQDIAFAEDLFDLYQAAHNNDPFPFLEYGGAFYGPEDSIVFSADSSDIDDDGTVSDNNDTYDAAIHNPFTPFFEHTGDTTTSESDGAEDNEAQGPLPILIVPQLDLHDVTYDGDAEDEEEEAVDDFQYEEEDDEGYGDDEDEGYGDGEDEGYGDSEYEGYEDGEPLATTTGTDGVDMVYAQGTTTSIIDGGFPTFLVVPVTSSEESHNTATQFPILAQENDMMSAEPMVLELDDMVQPAPLAANDSDRLCVDMAAVEHRLVTAKMMANYNFQTGASIGYRQGQSERNDSGGGAEATYTEFDSAEENKKDDEEEEEVIAVCDTEDEDEDEYDDEDKYHTTDDGCGYDD
ncbi:hypothetical protein BG004_003469 [Podila humilis]|nr:hypothetical protein BG004_003469 [Podila humilis]